METFLVQDYLNKTLRNDPDKVAATDGINVIRYRDLSIISNKLANCLIQNGVDRQEAVVIFMRRSVHYLVAILGILKADAIYVPIDHDAPRERFEKIVKDCRPSAVICDEYTINKLMSGLTAEHEDFPVMFLTSRENLQRYPGSRYISPDQIYGCDKEQPDCRNSDTDIAYILYTSGSTGNPKGVMISHLNIKKYIDWVVEFININENDRILGTAPFHFDMSTFDVYAPLKVGATLCIAREALTLFPEKLMRFIEQEKVTVWKGVSSMLMYMARVGVLKRGRMDNLKRILFAGETLPTKYLIEWMKAYPDKMFYNAYGPTEATGISLCHFVEKIPKTADERIPIGKPRKDTIVYLLNEDNIQTVPGEVGELCIAGPCLSRGYLNDQAKTEKAFVQNPLSVSNKERIYRTGDLARLNSEGAYEFIGRKDNQIKMMGNRIELSEIEHQLQSIEKVKDAVVILSESEDSGIKDLVAFFESDSDITLSDMRAELEIKLPPYMIPKRLIRIESIPRCERGKISRESLHEYYSKRI